MKKIYVKKSNIHGKGIFLKVPLKKGEVAFIVKGERKKMIFKTKEESLVYPDMIGIDKNEWIDPKDPYRFINHSCNPNLGTKGKVTFVALKDIKAGEELTFDYSISEDSLWEMECNCGESNCRKVIRSIKYLPEECFRSYFPFIPSYFKKKYLEINKDIL